MMQVPGQSLHWRPVQIDSDHAAAKMQAMTMVFLNALPPEWGGLALRRRLKVRSRHLLVNICKHP